MNSFLQSKEWAEFQESVGRKTFLIDNKLIIELKLPLGLCYLYSSRPYFEKAGDFTSFAKEIAKLAKKENAIFVKVEPDINSKLEIIKCQLKTVKGIQPQDTIILEICHMEEKILEQMHPKTRYNIRVAQKHNIRIEKTIDPEKIDVFYNLAIKTASRDEFRYHNRAYYKQMLKNLGEKHMLELLIGYSGNNPTAAILVLFYKKNAIYLHGASDYEFRNLMSPYLLQWEAIKEAKKRGCTTYDFWGIAPLDKRLNDDNVGTKQSMGEMPNEHPWAGITRFKKGFAPNNPIVHYPNSIDLIYKPFWYKIYTLIKRT